MCIRDSTYPDPEADRGEHRFAYSLLPHAGGWDELTIANAYALNNPLIVWPADQVPNPQSLIPNPQSLISTDLPNVVIETIKQAQDGQGLIVRLYESQRRRGKLTLTTGFPLAQVWRTNLIEENREALDCDENSVTTFIKPYQILTLRLLPQLG